MLVQLIGGIAVIGIGIGMAVSVSSPLQTVNHAHAGVLVLHAKFDAIFFSERRSFNVTVNHHPQFLATIGPCTLPFTQNGNASHSTTCEKSHKLTLRPGEGGIGYHW